MAIYVGFKFLSQLSHNLNFQRQNLSSPFNRADYCLGLRTYNIDNLSTTVSHKLWQKVKSILLNISSSEAYIKNQLKISK